jgi:glutaminyl-tRNA synthetase
MAAQKGTPTQPGADGPYRNRSIEEKKSCFVRRWQVENGDFPLKEAMFCVLKLI